MPIPGSTLAGIQLMVFDLDGTLIDSRLDLTLSVNATLKHLQLAPLSEEVVSTYIGHGVRTLVHRALGTHAQDGKVDEALAYFLKYYEQHLLDHTALYPGVREALADLASLQLAVLSNKNTGFSQTILEGLGVAAHFKFIFGGDSFAEKKPDPRGLLMLMERTGTLPAHAMMVGDSDTDIFTGRNAGAWTCGVTYGIGRRTLDAALPDLMVADLRELPLLLRGGR
jgi:phosphoglycolate phosphatase